MKRRTFLNMIAAIGASAALAAVSRRQRPNIILFMIDDLGWRDIACAGNPFHETPNIDRLAKEGVLFTQAYSSAPSCAPTRACLITGQYTPRHGIYMTGEPDKERIPEQRILPIASESRLNPESVTLAETLKAAGYQTALVGKWNLSRGCDRAASPLAQGFDIFIDSRRMGYHKETPYFANGRYSTDVIADETVNLIQRFKDEAFFILVTPDAVHAPHEGKPELVAKYKKKPGPPSYTNPTYAASVESVDQMVGRVSAELERAGIREQTTIAFTSDNGGEGETPPLRGKKGSVEEGGIRVPMIVSGYGVSAPGRRCDIPVNTVDFYPTFLELAATPRPADHALDGESLGPILRGGGALKRDAIFWHLPVYHARTVPCSVIRSGDFKLVEYFDDGSIALYDLISDPGETRNLASARPNLAQTLREELAQWRKSVGAPTPSALNPDYNASFSARKKKRRVR